MITLVWSFGCLLLEHWSNILAAADFCCFTLKKKTFVCHFKRNSLVTRQQHLDSPVTAAGPTAGSWRPWTWCVWSPPRCCSSHTWSDPIGCCDLARWGSATQARPRTRGEEAAAGWTQGGSDLTRMDTDNRRNVQVPQVTINQPPEPDELFIYFGCSFLSPMVTAAGAFQGVLIFTESAAHVRMWTAMNSNHWTPGQKHLHLFRLDVRRLRF